ncbi:hypothetical protein BpHYR1_009859 [Brachionus plicatilis]|uniref:Uncharacterized protein n=1 Tax=Brachionus plicatilis TaxID=10195 RepID=A0A3M7SEJ8_BRAPC|nr:hypothetical protein BpHYR1_009859 [Brachionus plicatilis]
MYPESNYQKVSLVNVEPQVGPNDCGLFFFAFDQMLAYGRDPFEYKLNQARMRQTFNFFVRADAGRMQVGYRPAFYSSLNLNVWNCLELFVLLRLELNYCFLEGPIHFVPLYLFPRL